MAIKNRLILYWVFLQIEEMSESHEASLMEMETAHSDTLATLQEEHARTVKSRTNVLISFTDQSNGHLS